MRWSALALCALLAVASFSSFGYAQECDADVSAAVAPLKAELKSANEKREMAMKEALTCKGHTRELKELLETKTTELSGLKAKLTELEASLAAEIAKAAAKAELDFATIASALGTLAKKGAISTYEEAQAVLKELQSGKTDRLQGHVSSALTSVKTAGAVTVAFIQTEADEHLPPAVKAQISQVSGKVAAAWKEHVADAAWAQPLLAQFRQVEAEVTKVVTRAVNSSPALKPLADPVTIQLAVYAVFATPILLLLLLPVVLSSGKPRAEAGSAGAGASRKNKKGPRPAGGSART